MTHGVKHWTLLIMKRVRIGIVTSFIKIFSDVSLNLRLFPTVGLSLIH